MAFTGSDADTRLLALGGCQVGKFPWVQSLLAIEGLPLLFVYETVEQVIQLY